MNDEILKDHNQISECCNAPMYANIDICSDCKEHSSPIQELCGTCGCQITSNDAFKYDGYCFECYDNEIRGMTYE